MGKKNKPLEDKRGDEPRASKWKQQSAHLASTISTTEMAKKPKAVATEATLSSPPPPAEVANGASATNVAEDDRILPHYQSMWQCQEW